LHHQFWQTVGVLKHQSAKQMVLLSCRPTAMLPSWPVNCAVTVVSWQTSCSEEHDDGKKEASSVTDAR